ncbi:MAG TPA: hypothetical protein VFE05_02270 [Longimicrobiaceae bacterium]|jgi:hypothetical protein|nr:hypothetical protein [Longimicrobiaceae bacterium]
MAALGILLSSLLLTSMGCAIGSALLQILAWTRHSRPGAQASVASVWKPRPEQFDDTGLRQMLLARRLIIVTMAAYLSYGVVMLLVQTFGGH